MKHTTSMRKKEHTRAEYERKDKVTSIRCSESQLQRIQSNAKAAGMSVNNYLVTTGANGGGALNPELMVQLQNIANEASSAVAKYAPEMAQDFQKGVNEVWPKLI